MTYTYQLKKYNNPNNDDPVSCDSVAALITEWDKLSDAEQASVYIKMDTDGEPVPEEHSPLYEIAMRNKPALVKACARNGARLHDWENKANAVSVDDKNNSPLHLLLTTPLQPGEAKADRISTISHLIQYAHVVVPSPMDVVDYRQGPFQYRAPLVEVDYPYSHSNEFQDFFVYAVCSNEPVLVEALVRSYNPPREMESLSKFSNRQQLSHMFDKRFDADKNFIDVACEKDWENVIRAVHEVSQNQPIMVTKRIGLDIFDTISHQYSVAGMMGYKQASHKEVREIKHSFWDVVNDDKTAFKAIEMLGYTKICGDKGLHKLINRLGFEEICNALQLNNPTTENQEKKLILYAHSVYHRLSMNGSPFGDEKMKRLGLELGKASPEPKEIVAILKEKQNPFGIGAPDSYTNIPKTLLGYVDTKDSSKNQIELKKFN